MKTFWKILLGVVAIAVILLVTPFGVVAVARGGIGAETGLPAFLVLPFVGLAVGGLILLARSRIRGRRRA